MSEVHRYDVVVMLSEAGGRISYDPHGPEIVLAREFDRVTAERDAALGREVALLKEREITNRHLDRMVEHSDALQQRLTAADELLDQAVTALNEIARVSRMGEKPFEIATLAIGEISALNPAQRHPCPVSLDGCDGACKPAEGSTCNESNACPKCNGTGEADSGGVQPWGEGINIPCDCKP